MLSSKNQFVSLAKPIALSINGMPGFAAVKLFSTGSIGWYANGKIGVQLGEDVDTALPITINGQPMQATPKHFSTGNVGWNLNGKINVDVGGEIVKVQVGGNLIVIKSADGEIPYGQVAKVQVGINLTVVGSKELPLEEGGSIAGKVPAAVAETEAPTPPAPKKSKKRKAV